MPVMTEQCEEQGEWQPSGNRFRDAEVPEKADGIVQSLAGKQHNDAQRYCQVNVYV
jgi:hypothetical protein